MTGTVNKNKVSQRNQQVKVLRQKTLLPTLKEQQRYLVYKIPVQLQKSSFDKIHNDIISQCNTMLGIFEGPLAGLMSAKYNPEKNSGIIRVSSKYVDKLKVCLGLIKGSSGQAFSVDCVYVSGMLNKAVEKMNNA